MRWQGEGRLYFLLSYPALPRWMKEPSQLLGFGFFICAVKSVDAGQGHCKANINTISMLCVRLGYLAHTQSRNLDCRAVFSGVSEFEKKAICNLRLESSNFAVEMTWYSSVLLVGNLRSRSIQRKVQLVGIYVRMDMSASRRPASSASILRRAATQSGFHARQSFKRRATATKR